MSAIRLIVSLTTTCAVLSGPALGAAQTCEAVDPAWSPDGAWIAFASDCEGGEGNLELYRIRPDGSGLLRLTTTPGSEHGPAWSPDGLAIAYAYDDQAAGTELRRIDAAGDSATVLHTAGSAMWGPTWSPDGRALAYEKHGGETPRIYVLDLASGQERAVTPAGLRAVAPAWSPSGTTIAFQGLDGERYRILAVDAADAAGAPRVLARVDGHAAIPAWSPDGAGLVFACQIGEESDTELCRVAPGSVDGERLTRDARSHFAPEVASDGRVTFMSTDGTGWRVHVADRPGAASRALPLPGAGG